MPASDCEKLDQFEEMTVIPVEKKKKKKKKEKGKKEKKHKKRRSPSMPELLGENSSEFINRPPLQMTSPPLRTNSFLQPISYFSRNPSESDLTISTSYADIPSLKVSGIDNAPRNLSPNNNNHPNSVCVPKSPSEENGIMSAMLSPLSTSHLIIEDDISMKLTPSSLQLRKKSLCSRRVSLNLQPTIIESNLSSDDMDRITETYDRPDSNGDSEKNDLFDSSMRYSFEINSFGMCDKTDGSGESVLDYHNMTLLMQTLEDQAKNAANPSYDQAGNNNNGEDDLGTEIPSAFMFDDDDEEEEQLQKYRVYELLEGKNLSWRRRLGDIFEGNPHIMDKRKALIMNVVILLTIVISCLVFVISSMPEYTNEGLFDSPLFCVETGCIVIFVLEVIVRVAVTRRRNLINLFFIIDILAILGYFLDLLVNLFADKFLVGFAILRIVRLIRVFRIFKLSRHSKSLQLTYVVLRNSASDLTVLLVPVVLIVTFFGCALYLFELLPMRWVPSRRRWEDEYGFPALIQSIPDAIWLCMETITTVGYGDVVPLTVGGQLCAIVVQLTGVLLLSFPNIVLGGNLQFAFKSHSKYSACKCLGKKFRKVRIALGFIIFLKQKVEERKLKGESNSSVEDDECVDEFQDQLENHGGDKQGIGLDSRKIIRDSGGRNNKKAPINYLMQKQEFEMYRKEEPSITMETLRTWKYNNITAVSVLQRLLEVCSGVGTTDEIHQSFLDEGSGILLKDLDIVVLYLFEAGLLQVFVFKRFGLTMLCALTPASVRELQVHPEENGIECIRSAEAARVLWHRTVGATVTFTLSQLIVTYPYWASSEKMTDNEFTPVTDFKQLFDPKSKFGSMSRSRTSKSVVSVGGHLISAVPLSDAKEHMRKVLAAQTEKIESLRETLRVAEQNVTNMYGF